MGWFGRILCLGRKNLGCIRFAFQEEGSWPGHVGQDRSGWKPGWRGPPHRLYCVVYTLNLGQEMRTRLEMGIGTRPDTETRKTASCVLRVCPVMNEVHRC